MSDTIGGRYRILRPLGAGGMGTVYEAVDSVSGHVVAVKVVTAEVANNEALRGRFEREIRAARGLDTPHVVRFLDAGCDAGSGFPFLVMELLAGEDLQHTFGRLGPVQPDLALRMVVQACRGLEVAHAQRVIHRDIKPANLFLTGGSTGERTIKILDFGIAKLLPDGSLSGNTAEMTGLTRTNTLLGSPLYMGPEQARGQKTIDHRADLWSLGVVLYQALTGRTPHQESTALGELLVAICTQPAAPVQSLAPWVPSHVAAIADRALALDPNARFQSAAEMRAAMEPSLTSGFAIFDEMLVPLSDADRVPAPRLEALALRPAYSLADQPTVRGAWPNPRIETPTAMQLGTASASSSADMTAPSPRARRSLVGVVAAGAVVATLAVAGRFALLNATASKPGVASLPLVKSTDPVVPARFPLDGGEARVDKKLDDPGPAPTASSPASSSSSVSASPSTSSSAVVPALVGSVHLRPTARPRGSAGGSDIFFNR